MIVYRLSRKKFKEDLTGKGAEKAGGRWNSRGRAMLYTGQSRALCTAEIAVHIPLGEVPEDYFLVAINIPGKVKMYELPQKYLPADWKSFPHPGSTQALGDQFLSDNKYLVMKVPSVVVQGDFNFLINPAHSSFSKMEIISTEVFGFDERLFKR